MPSDSSKPTSDPRDAPVAAPEESPDDEMSSEKSDEMTTEEAKAVETFRFEASAGKKIWADDPQPAAPQRVSQSVESPESPSVASAQPTSLAAEQPPVKSPPSRVLKTDKRPEPQRQQPRPQHAAPLPTRSKIEVEGPQPVKRAKRGLPSSTISLIVHGLLILLLSLYTLGLPPKEEELGLFASTAAYEEVEDFQDLEIDPSEEMESLDSDLAAELSDPGAASFGDLSAESALADVSGDSALSSDTIGELGDLFGEAGSGSAEEGEGLGAATASFFGTKVEGRRILYLLDNSGGMKGGKLEALIEELLKSVASLQPRQEFYVIFYSDSIYPLFYPEPATEFVRATKKNREYLREWLNKVELRTGNKIDEALEAAVAIRPDTVFLLTDGELFTTVAKERLLLDGTSRNFPINTFGMGVKAGSQADGQLRLVAKANQGTYQVVDVSPKADEMENQ